MSARTKILLVVGVFTLFVVGASLAAYAAWTREGIIQIDVSSTDGRGGETHVELPAAIVPIALHCMPNICVSNDEDFEKARRYMPVVRKTWREIREAPDGILVAVDGPERRVRVEKKGQYLLIDVRDGEDLCRVRCPLRTVDAVTNRLAGMTRVTI